MGLARHGPCSSSMSPLPAPPQQVYSSYARSHLYYAAELLLLVILLLLVETTVGMGGGRGG